MKSNIYKVITIVMSILGFIGGIASGKVFQTTKLIENTINPSLNRYEHHFNTALMFYVWIGFAILVLVFFGIYAILNNQEQILAKLTCSADEKPAPAPITDEAEHKEEIKANAYKIATDYVSHENQIQCEKCGHYQSKDIQRCLSCGELISEN